MKALGALLVLLAALSGVSYAAEEGKGPDAELDAELEALLSEGAEVPIYVFPEIKPELSVFLGYRFVESGGSALPGEYVFEDDSVMFGGHARMFKFPHRVFLEFGETSRKEYFGEARYAYRDAVLARYITEGLFHNLPNIKPVDLDPATAAPGVDRRDEGDDYGIRYARDKAYLRLKAPDFPAHAYVDYTLVRKDGTAQQRSLQGSGWFDNAIKTTEGRDIDRDTEYYSVGANSHLGPVEADLSHTEKSFDPGGDKVLFDPYTNSLWPAGTYAHNLVPELEGSSDTIKLHTSYTGRLVASATFSLKDRKNNTSGAEADYLAASGGLTWKPAAGVAFFARYRHLESEIDNTDTVTATDISTGNSLTYAVRPSIEPTVDTLTLNARYRAAKALTLRAKYLYENTERENAGAWGIREQTSKNEISISGDLKASKTLGIRAAYEYATIDDPAYNTEPDDSYEGALSVSWLPAPGLGAFLSYTRGEESREFLRFEDETSARNREVDKDRLLASGTYSPGDRFSVTLSYAYIRNKTDQDLVYEDVVGSPNVAEGARYKDSASAYSLEAGYSPTERLGLSGGVTYTESKGSFATSAPGLTEPLAVSELWDYKFFETVYTVSGDYRLGGGFNLGVEYRFSDLDEDLANPHDDIESGDVQVVMLTLEKRWE